MEFKSDAPFVIVRDFAFFTPLDIISTILGLAILFILVYTRQQRNRTAKGYELGDKSYYRYYLPAFSFKVLLVLANAIFYIVVYRGGGDSIGFWDGSVKLNQLFWKDPFAYFQEIFTSSEMRTVYHNFDIQTGYPDTKIYSEPSSFFVSKIASVFTFFTFKGYLLMSLIFAYISTNASWRLYELVRSYKLHSDRILAFAIFFIPSLSFWCGGISKDTVVFVTLIYLLLNIYKIISLDQKSSFRNWLVIFICFYVLFHVRSFMIVTVLVPLLFAYTVRLVKKYKDRAFERNSVRIIITLIGIGGVIFFLQSPIAEEFLTEAAVIHKDMTTNKTYGTNRYDLGITDYSAVGMLMAFPVSVIAGFYQPFLWEALNATLILNGIESMLLLFFTARFFLSRHVGTRIQAIRKHEFLIFALFFALILAYFAGFTSGLFGVLVRFKAPVLPFLVIILTAHYGREKGELETSN